MSAAYNLIPENDYVNACNAIRDKTGTTALLKSAELAPAIGSIKTQKPEQEKTASATKNGPIAVTPDNGKVLSKATVNVAVPSDKKPEQTKSVTYTTNGRRTVSPDNGKVLTGVSVNVNVPSKKPVVQALTATENKTYTPPYGVDGYSPVTVNVSGGGGSSFEATVTIEIGGMVACSIQIGYIEDGVFKEFGTVDDTPVGTTYKIRTTEHIVALKETDDTRVALNFVSGGIEQKIRRRGGYPYCFYVTGDGVINIGLDW